MATELDHLLAAEGGDSLLMGSSEDDGVDDSSDSMALLRAVRSQPGAGGDGGRTDRGHSLELALALDNCKKENQQLREVVVSMKARETEMAAIAMQLQQQWNTTQHQIANIKLTLHAQLQSPISQEEFFALEQRPEVERDLVDTIKLGVYRQLGALSASLSSALKKAGDLAIDVDRLEKRCATSQQELREKTDSWRREKDTLQSKIDELESRAGQLPILTQRLADAEHRLQAYRNEKEQFFDIKVQLGAKTNECARLELALKEAEDRAHSFKMESECSEQKLDILKSEYYESKLQFGQRLLQLEGQLRVANEKLDMLKDLELEADIFMNNMAGSTGVGADGTLTLPFDVPVSRRLQHSLSVTKRALALENQLVAVKHELETTKKSEARLAQSLQMAQAALSDSGHPYALVEDALLAKDEEIQRLKDRIVFLEGENAEMEHRIVGLTTDLTVLTKHRTELQAMKQALQSLPFAMGGPGAASFAASPRRIDSSHTTQGHARTASGSGAGRLDRAGANFDAPQTGSPKTPSGSTNTVHFATQSHSQPQSTADIYLPTDAPLLVY